MTEPMRDEAGGDDQPPGGDGTDDMDAERTDASEHPTIAESVVTAFLEARPEVSEHLVKAANELLLAAQVVVRAADDVIQEQQAARAARMADAGGPDPDADAAVRHLDFAE
jgi:hypothetical protein